MKYFLYILHITHIHGSHNGQAEQLINEYTSESSKSQENNKVSMTFKDICANVKKTIVQFWSKKNKVLEPKTTIEDKPQTGCMFFTPQKKINDHYEKLT